MIDEKSKKKAIPIREGLFVIPLESGENPYLIGSKCKVCGKITFPQRLICSECFSEDLELLPLSQKGKLYTFTIIGYPPPGVEAPYAIGYVDLPEGVRVFSILVDWDKENLKLGMDVELVIGKFKEDKEGNEVLTYKFRPIS